MANTTNPEEIAFLQALKANNLYKAKELWAEGGINIEATIWDNEWNAITTAAKHCDADAVEWVLSLGANPDTRTRIEQDVSPFAVALEFGKRENAEHILKALQEKYKDDPEKYKQSVTTGGGQWMSVETHAIESRSKDIYKKALAFYDQQIKARGAEIIAEIPKQLRGVKRPVVAIVGSGLSGMMMAMELIRKSNGSPLEIVMIESDKKNQGGGLAYGADNASEEHVVNIQAERMSPFPGYEDDFRYWLEERHYKIARDEHDAVPRRLYAEYLKSRLNEFIESNPHIKLTRKTGETRGRVINVEEESVGVKIEFEAGKPLWAHHVLLATGHTTSTKPKFLQNVEDNPRVLSSQWGERGRKFVKDMNKDGSVFVVGTSMSAFDAVVSLRKNGHRGKIILCSRNGLTHPTYRRGTFPSPIASFTYPEFLIDIPHQKGKPEEEIIDYFTKGIRREWFKLTGQGSGIVGEQILNNWEQYVPQAVQLLEDAGVSRASIAGLLKKHKSLIDTNRIGVSWKIGEEVNDAILDGQVEIWKADIKHMQGFRNGVDVNYTMTFADGTEHAATTEFDYVISSLGQEMDYTKVRDPLWQKLIEDGVVTPHWTNIGINVGLDGQIIGANGKESHVITAVGPMRAGDTMVTERDYGEKYGSGGRLGPPAFSVVALKDLFGPAAIHILDEIERQRIMGAFDPTENSPAHERVIKRIKALTDGFRQSEPAEINLD